MNKLEKSITTTIIFLFAIVVLFYDYVPNTAVIYDCTMIEFYRNVPEEVKQECESINNIPSNSKIIKA